MNSNMTVHQHIKDTPEKSIYVASQLTLIWRRFRRHRLAMISLFVVVFIYIVVLFAEFFAPFPAAQTNTTYTYAPPQTVNLLETVDGRLHFNPHVFGYTSEVDPEAFRRVFTIDETQKIPIGFFVQGSSYKLLGLFETTLHFMGPKDAENPMYLLGADKLGRDVLSRLIYGTRLSMSIGLIGVIISLVLGMILGGISGYFGGIVDNLIQRTIEFVRSLPTIPLWLGFSAALPLEWEPAKRYFAITIILSFIGWTSLARVIRGQFLSIRNEDYILAARIDGASRKRIISLYMLPAFTSHIIATVSLAIPGMILAETALSFLGLGIQPPSVSWGVLLQDAQNVRAIATAPWLLSPAVAVVVAVLALNFLGDGLRDAADPYG